LEKDERDPGTGQVESGNKLAVRHGAHSFLKTGKVPPVRGARKLRKELSRLRKELEEITPDLNVKKRLVVNQVVSAAGFMGLVEIYVRKVGLPRADLWRKRIFDVQPAFSFYLSMMNRQLSALQLLGLDRKEAEELINLGKYIELKDKEKAAKDEEKQA